MSSEIVEVDQFPEHEPDIPDQADTELRTVSEKPNGTVRRGWVVNADTIRTTVGPYEIQTKTERKLLLKDIGIHRVGIITELVDRNPGIPIVSQRDVVPLEVVGMGNAAVAAYAYSIHDLGRYRIASLLDVNQRTVRQYLSDFRKGRR